MAGTHLESVNGAFVVILTSNNYFLGVKVLHWSLESVGSVYPLVVLYTLDTLGDTHVEELRNSGCILKITENIVLDVIGDHEYAQPYYRDTWTKLQAFNLTEYSRVVLLDADMLIRKNIDELMTLEIPDGWIAASSSCVCNPMKSTSYPANWVPENCYYTYYNSDSELKGKCSETEISYFNSGLVLLQPSTLVFNQLKNRLKNIETLEKYNFPDQDFLNEVYKGKWYRLPYTYNALRPLTLSHADMWNDDEVRVVHYIFKKPWLDEEWKTQTESERKDNKFYTVNSWWFDAFEKSKN